MLVKPITEKPLKTDFKFSTFFHSTTAILTGRQLLRNLKRWIWGPFINYRISGPALHVRFNASGVESRNPYFKKFSNTLKINTRKNKTNHNNYSHRPLKGVFSTVFTGAVSHMPSLLVLGQDPKSLNTWEMRYLTVVHLHFSFH